ncbi:hypothetical protein [Pseudomonas defluvii]|uniref:hypothetical protein n=1 Tax=Pseudomonas defluvii TaxID=1876757 RepID=UPI003905B7C9
MLHCGLGHGQATDLMLIGVDGAFCSHSGVTPSPISFDKWLGDTLGGTSRVDCPLCSHTGTVLLPFLFIGIFTARRGSHATLSDHPYTWPRRLWPPANPRASPALS